MILLAAERHASMSSSLRRLYKIWEPKYLKNLVEGNVSISYVNLGRVSGRASYLASLHAVRPCSGSRKLLGRGYSLWFEFVGVEGRGR